MAGLLGVAETKKYIFMVKSSRDRLPSWKLTGRVPKLAG